jgi:hypothetical protein
MISFTFGIWKGVGTMAEEERGLFCGFNWIWWIIIIIIVIILICPGIFGGIGGIGGAGCHGGCKK